MKTKTKKKIINSQNQLFYKIDQESVELKDLSKELARTSKINNQKSPPRKEKLSLKECIKKLNYLSNLKIRKNYNCTPVKYENYIVEYLLNNADCHLVSIFKEKMLTDYVDEFLRREYNINECKERIPKFSIYYKNYLQFFCKPTYNNFKFNDLIQNYGEKKAELYYKDHYQGGLTNEDEDNGFEESSSDETTNKENEYEFNENGEIFNKIVKEKLDNVTVMTTINTTGNNTINLNINNEKIEVFSENKAEVSNDTTINDIMEDIKKEIKKIKNKKKDSIKNKFKNSYKKILNYSLKNQEKSKENKSHKNISIEPRKKATSKDYSKKNMLSKEKKDIYKDKDKEKINLGDKIFNQKIKSQLFKYNVESHKINKNNLNKMTHNKIQKILKKRYSKNIYNNIYNNQNYNFNYKFNYNKESHINLKNTSSNKKSPENKQIKKNSISGLSNKKLKYRSRNNFGTLYKNITAGTNTTTNKNTNNNYQTTHFNKNSLSNLVQFGNNVFKTMNFMQTAHHQRTNSQLIKKKNLEKNKNKFQVPNAHPDKKTSSLKMLVTDSGNPNLLKPTIKIKKNEKLKSKTSNCNINNKNILINNNGNNINNKITVTTNNYFNNLNNRYNKNTLKKTYVDSSDSLTMNNQNYSNFANQMSAQQLIYNSVQSESIEKNYLNNNYHAKSNGNLMQIALSLLIENNSPNKHMNQHIKNSICGINNSTSINNNNNNKLIKANIINQKNNRKSYSNLNSGTQYSININNQINININNKGNNKSGNFKGSKIKTKSNKKNININQRGGIQQKKNISKKKTVINTNSNNKRLLDIPGLNNKIKIRTRNYNISSLNNGLTQNYHYIYNDKNDKIIKGYQTKSVSNLNDLINHNKQLISLYKSMSKSKSKDKK